MPQKITNYCEGAKYQLEQFRLFDKDNTKGINYHTRKPKEVEQIFNQNPVLHVYSLDAFKRSNFKNHAATYKLSKTLPKQGRTQCQLLHNLFYFILFYFYSYHC